MSVILNVVKNLLRMRDWSEITAIAGSSFGRTSSEILRFTQAIGSESLQVFDSKVAQIFDSENPLRFRRTQGARRDDTRAMNFQTDSKLLKIHSKL